MTEVNDFLKDMPTDFFLNDTLRLARFLCIDEDEADPETEAIVQGRSGECM